MQKQKRKSRNRPKGLVKHQNIWQNMNVLESLGHVLCRLGMYSQPSKLLRESLLINFLWIYYMLLFWTAWMHQWWLNWRVKQILWRFDPFFLCFPHILFVKMNVSSMIVSFFLFYVFSFVRCHKKTHIIVNMKRRSVLPCSVGMVSFVSVRPSNMVSEKKFS